MRKLITGGGGFIGSNFAHHAATQDDEVIIFDNLSRKGAAENINWLIKSHKNVKFINGDIVNDFSLLRSEINNNIDVVYHFAGQVAVTTSVINPRQDFEINALGSFNVLEACRLAKNPPIIFYSSTNKVYGGMENIVTIKENNRYIYKDMPNGIPENEILDFHSPYGCSKGSADQYFRDYSRIFGLKTVVFRQSCIYGERQFGIEDQGWMAWFTIACILNKNICIYGDGMQVRDVLHISDLILAYDMALANINITSGEIYNIGGGSLHSLSLLELIEILKKLKNEELLISYSNWRPGDQKVYISDCTKAENDFSWKSRVSPEMGITMLYKWVIENKSLVQSIFK
jgi:CDP-paratose 2-epimerase